MNEAEALNSEALDAASVNSNAVSAESVNSEALDAASVNSDAVSAESPVSHDLVPVAAADLRAVAASDAPFAPAPVQKPSARVARASSATAVAKPAASKPAKSRMKRPTRRGIISTVVMTAAAALVATMALPAYAFSMNGAFDPNTSARSVASGQQSLAVDASATNATVSRDNYQAPTKDELAAQQAAAAAAAAQAAAQAAALKVTAVSSAAVTGATASFDTSTATVPYDGQAVVDYAMQFVGKVPYGNGNSPDTSFSCDGLVQYVFKHFGINLPRTVSNQAAQGVRIPASEAQPGDVMIYPIGHTEIYAGHGMAVTAPDWGRMVEYDPVWGSYYFVRYGVTS